MAEHDVPTGRERVRAKGCGDVRGGVVAVYPDLAEVTAETRFEVRPDGIRQRFAAAKGRLAVKVSAAADLGPAAVDLGPVTSEVAGGVWRWCFRHPGNPVSDVVAARSYAPSRYRTGVSAEDRCTYMPRPFRGAGGTWLAPMRCRA